MLTKTGLRDLFSHYGFHPLKRFGENYLIDANIKDKIVHEVCVGPGDAVLEIGPGFGALTLDLAATGAKIYAVEKDKKAYAIFKEMLGDAHPRVRLICADILDFDLSGIKTKAKIRIIGNLPYYITTPIIEYIIAHKDRISSAFITVQREVALRMMAYPGSKEYGSLSCFVQYHTTPVQLFAIKRTSFYPEPEIDSSLVIRSHLRLPRMEVRNCSHPQGRHRRSRVSPQNGEKVAMGFGKGHSACQDSRWRVTVNLQDPARASTLLAWPLDIIDQFLRVYRTTWNGSGRLPALAHQRRIAVEDRVAAPQTYAR